MSVPARCALQRGSISKMQDTSVEKGQPSLNSHNSAAAIDRIKGNNGYGYLILTFLPRIYAREPL